MPIAGNNINNNQLAALAQRAGPELTATIQKASLKTGVDFSYMMEKAAAESNFDTDAQAKTSSARGMYQFIESTWLQMVNRYGDRNGLGEYADHINDQGKVTSAAMRKEILALRDDPEVASLMAGEFASENKRTLINSGISAEKIGSTELYLAHFLGAGAASQFIKGMDKNPLAPAADIFPKAAQANKNVFYNQKTHAARSFGEIYAFFDKKFDTPTGATLPAGKTLVADNNNEKIKTQTQAGAIAAYSPLRVMPANANINQITPDLMALMNGDFNSDEPSMFFGQSLSSAKGSAAQSALPSAKSLVADPVALMLMANLDLRDTGVSTRAKEASGKDDKQAERDSHTGCSIDDIAELTSLAR